MSYRERTPSVSLIKIYSPKYGKYLTCIEDLPEELDRELIIIDLMKRFSCKGHFYCEIRRVIWLHGNYLEEVAEFLVAEVGLEEGSFEVFGLED